MSPEVAHLARKVEGLDYVERGGVRLKGLEKPVEVVAVRPEREDIARDLAFRRALDPAAAGTSRRATRTKACARSPRTTRRTSSAGRR